MRITLYPIPYTRQMICQWCQNWMKNVSLPTLNQLYDFMILRFCFFLSQSCDTIGPIIVQHVQHYLVIGSGEAYGYLRRHRA